MSYQTPEARLRAALIADSAVAAAFAAGAALFAIQKPQSPNCPYPCAAIQRISTQRLYAQRLGSPQGASAWARFQFTVWGDGASGLEMALAAGKVLVDALETFNLMRPGVTLKQAPNFLLSERTGIEPQPSQPLAFYSFDAKVWFTELTT